MEEKAFEYIDAIAANLGVAAEHVYGALLKQAMVSGLRSVVYIIICLAVGYAIIKGLKRIYYDVKEGEEGFFVDSFGISLGGVFAIITGGVAIIILFFAVMSDISNATTALLNPEYWALKKILDTIKGAEY